VSAHVWTFHDAHGEGNPDCKCKTHWRHYRCDDKLETPSGLKIASVTQALGVLDKSRPLMAWATNVTMEGVHALARWNTPYRRCKKCNGVGLEERCAVEDCGGPTVKYRLPSAWWGLKGDLKSSGLSHESATTDAQERGTTVHKMREDWVNLGQIPNPAEEPEHWRGYVQAMARYILDTDRAGEVAESVETIIGSATHGFAGRCDEVMVSIGRDGKRRRRDFKTSKQAYARTHFRQLAAYEGGAVEMGEPPTDEQEVVILHDDGTYELVRSTATYQDFLNVLQVWRDDQPFAKHEDATYRARVAREKAARKAAS
jgi:hypothetical protein